MYKDIIVNVSGPHQAVSQYKTIVLKGNQSFQSQIEQAQSEITKAHQRGEDLVFKFVIKWDFNLGGESVTIPENCVLEFDGGSISGENSILFDKTQIVSYTQNIFVNVTFDGTIYGTFNVSWIKQINGVKNLKAIKQIYDCAFLYKAHIIWDIESLNLEIYDGFNGITLLDGINDFNGVNLNVINNLEDKTLFKRVTEFTELSGVSTIDEAVALPIFSNKVAILKIYDANPFTYRGNNLTSPLYRTDMLLVINNAKTNEVIAPYDEESSPQFSYVIPEHSIEVRNLKVIRSGSFPTTVVHLKGEYAPSVKNIICETDTLYDTTGDAIISIHKSINPLIEDVTIAGTYSTTSNFGYAFTLYQVANALFRRVAGHANWELIGSTDLNGFSIYNSAINNIDCHIYSKNFLIQNCNLMPSTSEMGYTTSISYHEGFIKYDGCTIGRYTPLFNRSDYHINKKVNLIFENCELQNVSLLVSYYRKVSAALPFTRRTLIQKDDLPDVTIDNCTIERSKLEIYHTCDCDVTNYTSVHVNNTRFLTSNASMEVGDSASILNKVRVVIQNVDFNPLKSVSANSSFKAQGLQSSSVEIIDSILSMVLYTHRTPIVFEKSTIYNIKSATYKESEPDKKLRFIGCTIVVNNYTGSVYDPPKTTYIDSTFEPIDNLSVPKIRISGCCLIRCTINCNIDGVSKEGLTIEQLAAFGNMTAKLKLLSNNNKNGSTEPYYNPYIVESIYPLTENEYACILKLNPIIPFKCILFDGTEKYVSNHSEITKGQYYGYSQ